MKGGRRGGRLPMLGPCDQQIIDACKIVGNFRQIFESLERVDSYRGDYGLDRLESSAELYGAKDLRQQSIYNLVHKWVKKARQVEGNERKDTLKKLQDDLVTVEGSLLRPLAQCMRVQYG